MLFSQSCPTLCNPMDCSTRGFPIHHCLLEFAQTHVHWVSGAIQPSFPVIPFSSCLQSFAASRSFPMSRLFASGGQSILCIYDIFSPFICHWAYRWFLSWLLWIMLQWTWEYRYLFQILISVSLALYPEVELVDQIVVLKFFYELPYYSICSIVTL